MRGRGGARQGAYWAHAARSGTTRTAASPDGVDLTLIRAFLALTPAQRLAAVEDRQDDLERIREHLAELKLRRSRLNSRSE